MKINLVTASLVLGLAGPVAASTLDFTANNDTSGSIAGTTWTASTRNADSLTNATHYNNSGCTGQGWEFACSQNANGRFDVGFGINGDGSNNNEIDGRLGEDGRNEFVQISFGTAVRITGWAGMLTYADVAPVDQGDREQVRLQYHANGSWVNAGTADPLFAINENSNTNFDTVGLAFSFLDEGIVTNKIRFRAVGRGTADDGTFNVTAAGLEVSAVPVPAALPLMLVGLGAFGFVARRNKRKAA